MSDPDLEEREAESAIAGLREIKDGDLLCTLCSRHWSLFPGAHPYFTCDCGTVWQWRYQQHDKNINNINLRGVNFWKKAWVIAFTSEQRAEIARIPSKNA